MRFAHASARFSAHPAEILISAVPLIILSYTVCFEITCVYDGIFGIRATCRPRNESDGLPIDRQRSAGISLKNEKIQFPNNYPDIALSAFN